MDLEPPLLRDAGGIPLTSRAALAAAVGRVASTLSKHGVREGDVVATTLPAGPALATAAAACWRLGAVHAPLGDRLPAPELERAVAAVRPLGLLASAGDGEVEWRRCGPARSEAATRPGDALLLLTSGSTGTPKAVILTRTNVAAGTSAVVGTYGLGEADATLALLPWTHGHGLLGVLGATAASGGSLLLGARGDPRAAVDAIAAGHVSWISVVPPLLALLVEAARGRPVGGRLRFIRTASAPLPAALAGRAEEVFDCPVAEAYGMTETSHQAAANPPDRERRRLGTVGLPTGTEWRLAGEEVGGGRLLEVRGPGVFRGYLGRPELTAAALTPDGWYRTLDVGRIETDGHLRLVGRRSEFINRGGVKVAPGEVEEAAASHPDVAACLAAPVPHPILGEEVGLLVVPRPDGRLDIGDLRRHCAERLAEEKRPRVIGLADSLPGLASGKPSRSLAGRLLVAGR